ncbi:hypothetical protein BG000_005972 [Podila horticola]|nr:hypothetical protein BG000_005972 [Podila horticola]
MPYEWFIAKETRYLSVSMEALSSDRLRYYKWARGILDHITVLDIMDALVHQEANPVGQLLCMTPCLEYFRASRARLYTTDFRPKQWLYSFKTNRERRIEARERGRKDLSPAHQASRRSVLEHMQSAREGKLAMNWSNYWQCLNLRSLELGIYGEAPDTSRLFRYLWLHCPVLRHLSIRCESIQMGQLVEYPEPENHGDTASLNSNDLAMVVGASPKRFPNHLRDLRGLEMLETVKIYTKSIQGIVAGDDFEFLGRPLDMRRQDQRQCEQRASKHLPRVTKELMGTIYEDDEGDDDIAVVLPFLTSIVFVYCSSPMKEDYRDVTEALAEIRPGVEFRFIERFTFDGSL